ncbi:MAG: sigma-70 family RNA polymerase sigma factor [Acidobacteria bacterium]|nr:sigma-70 family RNA polymerase sigma factor [Acidobacteriota bacterium]
MPDENVEITAYLRRLRDGDSTAEDDLANAVYGRMREMSHALMRANPGHPSVRPTALVNEVLLELMRLRTVEWNDRIHFYRAASRLMRRRLIDYIRHSNTKRRPPHEMRTDLDDGDLDRLAAVHPNRFEEIYAVHEALDKLGELDPPLAELVEMVYFGGVTIAAVAELRGVSTKTVLRHLDLARAVLEKFLSPKCPAASNSLAYPFDRK